MPNFAFAFYGVPQHNSEEASAAAFAEYKAWMDGLGEALINPGIPMGEPTSVNSAGVANNSDNNRLTGIAIVSADSLDAAIDIAKTCPYVKYGTIDVAEAYSM